MPASSKRHQKPDIHSPQPNEAQKVKGAALHSSLYIASGLFHHVFTKTSFPPGSSTVLHPPRINPHPAYSTPSFVAHRPPSSTPSNHRQKPPHRHARPAPRACPYRSGMGITGIWSSSGNLVAMALSTATHTDSTPIQFCLYGATTSSRSLSFDIVPGSIDWACARNVGTRRGGFVGRRLHEERGGEYARTRT